MSEWRRFEKASRGGGEGRYWEIRTNGSVCELRHGAVGGPAAQERLEHASAAEARTTAKQKIRTKQRAGWLEVEVVEKVGKPLESADAIERAIVAEPDNLDHWAVYADFLQEHAPLVGERVALSLALRRTNSSDERARLETRIEALEHTHARELFGATLAGLVDSRKFSSMVELERRHGMIVGVTLRSLGNPAIRLETVVEALLDLPIARLLTKLHIDIDIRHASAARVADAFVARQHPHLRELALCLDPPVHRVDAVELPSLAAVLGAAPRLERLELHAGWTGKIDSVDLHALKLVQPGALEIASWRAPELHTLHLIEPERMDWADVELPGLRRLLIEQRRHGDWVVFDLVRARVLAQLESLTLVVPDLGEHGLRRIFPTPAFGSLPRLDLLNVFVHSIHFAAVRYILPNANVFALDERAEPDESTRHAELTAF